MIVVLCKKMQICAKRRTKTERSNTEMTRDFCMLFRENLAHSFKKLWSELCVFYVSYLCLTCFFLPHLVGRFEKQWMRFATGFARIL